MAYDGLDVVHSAGNDILFDESQGAGGTSAIKFGMRTGWYNPGNDEKPYRRILPGPPYVGFHTCWLPHEKKWMTCLPNTVVGSLDVAVQTFWDDFCSWYLKSSNHLPGKTLDAGTYDQTLAF